MPERRLAIIANPRAGGGRAWRQVSSALRNWRRQDWRTEIYETKYPEHAGQIARNLLSMPPDRVAVCGGDGTVNEVLTVGAHPPFPLAVIPAGTANVLSKQMRIPSDPVLALDVAVTGDVMEVDLGVIRCPDPRHFLLMAGIGLDARVVANVRPWLKRMTGTGAYYLAGAIALLSYRFPEFRIVADDQEVTATACIIANSRGYGGDLLLTPKAEMNDGVFDLLVIQGRPKLGYARLLLAARRRVPFRFSWARFLRARKVRIDGPAGVQAQVDGELCGSLPLSAEVLPSSLRVVAARSFVCRGDSSSLTPSDVKPIIRPELGTKGGKV